MRQGAAGWLHVNTGPADRLTQNWSDDDRCRGLVSRHNGLHKTGPGPSIWHGHVQGCRGLRQRRSGPFKVSSRAALFSMHLKSGQYSHLTAICASRHYFFSFGRIAYVLSIHFLAPVSLTSKAGLPVKDVGEALRRRKSAECVFIRTECSIQNGWNTRCCAQVMEDRAATCTPHNTSKQCTAAWCPTAAPPRSAPRYFYCQQMWVQIWWLRRREEGKYCIIVVVMPLLSRGHNYNPSLLHAS